MAVQGGRPSGLIPPGKAVFIPAGSRHSIRMWGSVAARFVYFPASLDAAALGGGECRALSVTPLLRELISRVIGARRRWAGISWLLRPVRMRSMTFAAGTGPAGEPLERLFRRETELGFGLWRFIATFRKTFGYTPGRP